MYRPGLGDLEAVIAIAREGSFRRAALALGMSTTALSNAVAKLETNLGARLFNRTTRSVSLSDAGRSFVERVSPALRDIQDAMAGVRAQQQTPSGLLRINAFAAGAREIMSPLVLEYLRLYPNVHIDLVTEGRLVDIVADGFDEATVRRVEHLLYVAEYKRRQAPPGPKVTRVNFGRDRRYPITNGWRDR